MFCYKFNNDYYPYRPPVVIDHTGQLWILQLTLIGKSCHKYTSDYIKAPSSIPPLSNVEHHKGVIVFLTQDGRVGHCLVDNYDCHYYQLPKIVQLFNYIRLGYGNNDPYQAEVRDVDGNIYQLNLTTNDIELTHTNISAILDFRDWSIYVSTDGSKTMIPMNGSTKEQVDWTLGPITSCEGGAIINPGDEVIISVDNRIVKFIAPGIRVMETYGDGALAIHNDGSLKSYDINWRPNGDPIKAINNLKIDIKPVRFILLDELTAIEDDKGNLYSIDCCNHLKEIMLTKLDLPGRLIQQ